MNGLYIGVDAGTSAIRLCVIDQNRHTLDTERQALEAPHVYGARVEQDPQIWWQALQDSLARILERIDRPRLRRIAIDGTSGTLLLCDDHGKPLAPALMYNDTAAAAQAAGVRQLAPADAPVHGAGSSLAKLLDLMGRTTGGSLALHQADWLSGRLLGSFGISDENNALKLGYDARLRRWPDWLSGLGLPHGMLPQVVPPGQVLGNIDSRLAMRWGLPAGVEIVAGTTDSTAGTIAAGVTDVGQAVTSLGSTLVVKVLSERPVYAARHGVYSHRLGDAWLVGGASNAGGTVLRQFFSDSEITRYTALLQPDKPTGLHYYPLAGTGERFPVCDPHMRPRLRPRPASDAVFFQAILEGLAAIEQRAYSLLAELGAPSPSEVITVGGGADNSGWQAIRERRLGVRVRAAEHREAAYGAALLALGLHKPDGAGCRDG